MRCSKSCYLRDLELVDLFDNGVIEQVYSIISKASQTLLFCRETAFYKGSGPPQDGGGKVSRNTDMYARFSTGFCLIEYIQPYKGALLASKNITAGTFAAHSDAAHGILFKRKEYLLLLHAGRF